MRKDHTGDAVLDLAAHFADLGGILRTTNTILTAATAAATAAAAATATITTITASTATAAATATAATPPPRRRPPGRFRCLPPRRRALGVGGGPTGG